MILPDHPIHKKNDRLGRSNLAKKVAELILGFDSPDKESFVIGIEGAWGSGKSSFVNFVLEDLGDKVILFQFNPWAFSDQESLLRSFFNDFIGTLKPDIGEDVVGTLKKYGKVVADIDPGLSYQGVSFNPFKAFSSTVNAIGDDSLTGRREKINKAIRDKVKKKIVIVIDDIDRLDKDETRLIMKLVKMTANFPNTIFLLAYDRAHVAKRLEEDGWPGDEYLKKIVQVSFTLPEVDPEDMRQILITDLNTTVHDVYGEFKLSDDNQRRWDHLVYEGIVGLFKTIRDVKRFISSLRLNWSIVPTKDINVVDFISIEIIRVFFPYFYSVISANRSFFLGLQPSMLLRMGDSSSKRKQQFEEMLIEGKVTEKRQKEIVASICKELFPRAFDTAYDNDEWDRVWRNDRRICASERFGFYFQLGVPSGAVSEIEIDNMETVLDDKAEFSKSLLDLEKDKKLRQILLKITDRLDKLSPARLENLVSSMWDLEDRIDDPQRELFDFDSFESISRRITYLVLKNLPDSSSRKAFFDKTINATSSLYNPTTQIRSIEEQIEKGEPVSRLLMRAEDLVDAKKVIVERIAALSSAGTLHKVRRLSFILWSWKRWAGDEPVKKYVAQLVKTKPGIAAFVNGFVGMTYSSRGNYKDISMQGIGEFYPVDDLKKLVAEITDEDMKRFSKDEQEAIHVFRNPPKQW